MKKRTLLFLFLLCLIGCGPKLHPVAQTDTTTFQNPLFATPMRAMKPDGAVIQLSPTALIDLTNQTIDSCELLNETSAGLFMNCLQNDAATNYQDYPYFAEFVSIGPDETNTYCLVQETVFKTKIPAQDSFVGRARFFIPQSALRKNTGASWAQGMNGTQNASWVQKFSGIQVASSQNASWDAEISPCGPLGTPSTVRPPENF